MTIKRVISLFSFCTTINNFYTLASLKSLRKKLVAIVVQNSCSKDKVVKLVFPVLKRNGKSLELLFCNAERVLDSCEKLAESLIE